MEVHIVPQLSCLSTVASSTQVRISITKAEKMASFQRKAAKESGAWSMNHSRIFIMEHLAILNAARSQHEMFFAGLA
jgi:hypothetical protein